MTLPRRRSAFALGGVLLFTVAQADALVLYGTDGGSTNNLQPPSNGAPWEYVAGIDGNNASGVYLGYGFILTANHVTGPLASASINGSVYAIDSSYVPLQIGGADLKLLRILGDPMLDPLPLVQPNDGTTSKDVAYIAWGQGKGAEVPNQGWEWGGPESSAQRWGLNRTGASLQTVNGDPYLFTDFNRSGLGNFGEDEFSLALGDSGGGLFAMDGNTWRLIGIGALVNTQGQAFYDTNPGSIGDTPTRSYFVPVQQYRSEILAAIPEPGTAASLVMGALLLGARRRTRSRW